jgi:chloramphenicol-sensitive protein RarD
MGTFRRDLAVFRTGFYNGNRDADGAGGAENWPDFKRPLGDSMRSGYLYALGAFGLWGVLPIYWQLIREVPALQVVCHRIIWSVLLLVPLLSWTGQWPAAMAAISNPATMIRQVAASMFLAINWLAFVWAVSNGRMIESSLGYYINPLLNVLLGVLLLGERLRQGQTIAILLAATGVGWLSWHVGTVPWIAIALASSFCLYGLAKKTTSVPPLVSLWIEATVLLLPAIVYLTKQHLQGDGAFGTYGLRIDGMLLASGIVTSVPLWCFANAAQKLPLSTLGILQYLGPTLQFLLGWWVYKEPFDATRMIGFFLVWTALSIFAWDLVHQGSPAKFSTTDDPPASDGIQGPLDGTPKAASELEQ